MQKIAYSFLNLQPHEFWRLTMTEFNLMIEGFKMRDEAAWRKLAQMASWVTAPHVKRPINPNKLFGGFPKDRSEKRKTNPEKTKQVLSDLEKDMENRKKHSKE